MSDRTDLLNEIRAVFPAGATARIASSALNDLFEAYVLSGVLRAAQAESWSVTLEDMNEQPANVALFRRSPGNIYASAGSQNFTHFLLEHDDAPPLEAHVGIKVTGKTGVEHECDVAVLSKDTAEWCRMHGVHPKSSRLILAVECKFLAGLVPLHLGRAFVGLESDLSSQFGECHFVVNTSSMSVMKMLARQNRCSHEHVRPGSNRFDIFQNACRAGLVDYVMRERA
jgi:hypothetical protein